MKSLGKPVKSIWKTNEIHWKTHFLGKPMNSMGKQMKFIGRPMKPIGKPMKSIGKPMKSIGNQWNPLEYVHMCVHACTCMLANARTCMHIRVHDIVHHVNCARLGRRYCSFSVGRILRQLHPWKSTAFSRGVGAPSPPPPRKALLFLGGCVPHPPPPPRKARYCTSRGAWGTVWVSIS